MKYMTSYLAAQGAALCYANGSSSYHHFGQESSLER